MSLLKINRKHALIGRCGHMLALTCTILFLATQSIVQAQHPRNAKQIVILYTHRTLTPINADWDRGIRSSLAAGFDDPLDIEIEYLNLVRHKDPDYLRSWIELLKTKYAAKPPDLVIPVYVPALEFTLEHRETIFPDVPVVFCSAPLKLAERAACPAEGHRSRVSSGYCRNSRDGQTVASVA